MSLNSNTQELTTILDTMNNLPLGGGGLRQIGEMIDESGVLDGTEGTVEEKVEQVIDKAEYGKSIVDNLSQISFVGNVNMPETIEFDCINILYLQQCFYGARGVKTVLLKNTHNVRNMSQVIYNSLIETIGVLDLSSIGNGGLSSPFSGCPQLANIEFVPNTIHFSVAFTSEKLTAESKQSIFDGLAPVTTAQTLTLPSTLKILQSQVDSANEKGWTVAGGTVVSEEEYYA